MLSDVDFSKETAPFRLRKRSSYCTSKRRLSKHSVNATHVSTSLTLPSNTAYRHIV